MAKQPFRTFKQTNTVIQPSECDQKRKGKSFRCADLSLPRMEMCTYCRDVLPEEIKEADRRDRENEELELDMIDNYLASEEYGRDWI